ncbi:SIR2-like domain-containing protein [Pseudomonas graminis]|uniref:SIR2-like domain-containing protein n=2 Tax=Pseudomonas graminis TaxID=158627 RepID=A0A1I0J2M3_9PSED|nr:SIR2-like domain-containing protein [Pseudomonas graminis]
MIKLKQILSQSDTIIFLGSGISLWSGLPTWSGMIEELAKFVEQGVGNADLVRAEAKRGDLLQAASYGFDKLTKQQIGEFVRAACRYGKARPHEIHRKIVMLGPRCFLTTNYDDLIEQSLREWQPDRFYRPPVTNRQLTETAEIVHARAVDFIFKPHGDAADSESIILTREQYRRLLPHGESQAALESVKMLLASRPVLYLGFGLRDPDFLYVRDLLANTYKGGVRDHYAIMADIQEQEVDYWRRNYGIHLIGYSTIEQPDKSRDHTPLLSLLDALLERPEDQKKSSFDPESSDVLLALARHAAVLCRHPKQLPEFPIRVSPDGGRKRLVGFNVQRFNYGLVEKLLDAGPDRLLLIGLPGAGKTYALHRAAAELAEQLNNICLSQEFIKELVVVPIIVDLKLYRGDLFGLVNQSLPESLPLDKLMKYYKVKIFVDSFNEMPREFLENGSYEPDFLDFVARTGEASLVIGSRTTDGLSRLELPTFRLDYIEGEAVTAELARLGISFEGRFSKEMFRLIQRPFYFQYIISRSIDLAHDSHPKDFYRCLFDNVSLAFDKRFGFKLDIEQALSNAAYAALDNGAEAFQVTSLIGELSSALVKDCKVTSLDIINWLVSESILIPYINGRIGFIHQSVTEYLAATELARRYTSDPRQLKEKLSLRRWDQGLFLTLSFLSSTQSKNFLGDVVKGDMALAINASKYIETGRDEIVSELLSALYDLRSRDGELLGRIETAIEYGLQVSEVHEDIVRKFIQFGDSLGGIAASLLTSIKGSAVVQEIIELLFLNRHDFNFCLRAVDGLSQFVTEESVVSIASFADQIQAQINSNSNVDSEHYSGFSIAISMLLQEIELPAILTLLPAVSSETAASQYRAKLLCEILGEHSTQEALAVAGDLLLNGVKYAVEPVARIASVSDRDDDVVFAGFTYAHAVRLQEFIASPWASDALKQLCRARPDIANQVKIDALSKSGLLTALLLHCVDPEDMEPVFSELARIADLSAEERRCLPLKLLEDIDIDWAGRELLFLKLLRARDINLANPILGNSFPVSLKNLGDLDIGDITWWLEWMREESATKDGSWFLFRLGDLFGTHAIGQARRSFVEEFNCGSEFRHIILDYVLERLDVTTDEIGSEAISFLLAELSREKSERRLGSNLLGAAATESFITERLLPLSIDAQDPLRKNLSRVLERAGARHGRRYLI